MKNEELRIINYKSAAGGQVKNGELKKLLRLGNHSATVDQLCL